MLKNKKVTAKKEQTKKTNKPIYQESNTVQPVVNKIGQPSIHDTDPQRSIKENAQKGESIMTPLSSDQMKHGLNAEMIHKK